MYDYETNEAVTADDLGITQEEYDRLERESWEQRASDTGVVQTSTGRTVYAG